jgi:hypothetical protein
MKTAADFLQPSDLADGSIAGEITSISVETVDGRPQLVMRVSNSPKPVLIDRRMARALSELFGPDPLVEEFFANEGNLQ